MLAHSNLIPCNFTSHLKPSKPRTTIPLQIHNYTTSTFLNPNFFRTSIFPCNKRSLPFHVCNSLLDSKDSDKDPVFKTQTTTTITSNEDVKEGRDWTTSILLLVLWGGLTYYSFVLAPNQTPTTDVYFLKKLLFLKGDDGFEMNKVLVSLWNIMGLWPFVYSMLLLPSGRSSNSKIPVWPFLVLSTFFGVYALLPYFVLWKPPPPPVDESELRKWPLNFLESKLTAVVTLAAGLGLILYAGFSGGDAWKEFYQYFRESIFIHIMTIDFTLLSAFAPFWVYNDMTARKWYDKGSWLLPISLVPFLGPSLYLILRPSLSEMPVSVSPTSSEKD